MTRRELIEAVSQKLQYPKTKVGAVLAASLDMIRDAVAADDPVKLSGFGTLRIKRRAARTGRNPQTGEPVAIPAKATIRFTPSAEFKHQVNQDQE